MASTPTYEAAKRAGSVILTSANGTTISSAALTGVAAGTRVHEIRIYTGPTTAPGGTPTVAVIVDDGTNQTVIDVVVLSNAVDTRQAILRYDNLFLPGIGYSIKFQMRTALAAGATLHCEVFGADY